jgi:cytochrome c oxidase cbb3-type subunit 3
MTSHTRFVAAVLFTGAAMTGLVLAQGGATQTTPPAGQGAQGGQTGGPQPAAGDAGARGGRGGGQGGQGAGGRGGGQRRGGFTQFTREQAPQDVIVRGKSLYEANCASCHAADLRGAKGTNLLRSGTALSDQHGELVSAAVAKHTPTINLVNADSVAIAEYIHSVLATSGGQGSPPGRNPTNVELNVLVGDPKAGETYFTAGCASCHSVTGDLKGIGSKYADARALQNAWVSGTGGRVGGGGRGGGGNQATVTLANGQKLDGTLVRKDDFLVVLVLPDGTRKSMARTNGIPSVDVKDPNDAHKKMVLELDDPENKRMHDVTAYLWSVK